MKRGVFDEPDYHISAELDCTTAPPFGCACCRFGLETVRETRYALKRCAVSMYDVVTNRRSAKLVCANIMSERNNQPGQCICCFCMAECDGYWYAIQCADPLATDDREPYMFYTCSACSMFAQLEINERHRGDRPVVIRCADSCVLYEFDSMNQCDD
jgi:hypothetical protein